MNIFLVVICAFFFRSVNSFVVRTRQGYHKCFKSQHMFDKMLDLRFGFITTLEKNCLIILTVDMVQDPVQGDKRTRIHESTRSCLNPLQKQDLAMKHIANDKEHQGYRGGHYLICLENLQDSNLQTPVQLYIGQKLQPNIYMNGYAQTPLVESIEVIELKKKVGQIRTSLKYAQKTMQYTTSQGMTMDKSINVAAEEVTFLAFLQIGGLMLVGVFWVFLVLKLKEKMNYIALRS